MQAQSSKRPEGDVSSSQRRFFNCNRPGHLAWECRSRRTESNGRGTKQRPRQVDTRQVYTTEGEVFPAHSERTQSPATTPGLLSYQLSTDSEDSEDGVRQIRISDQGSRQQHADILIAGVPARGIIDSGAEITIIGGELLRRIAAVARLKKSQLKQPDDGESYPDRGMGRIGSQIRLIQTSLVSKCTARWHRVPTGVTRIGTPRTR